jgi:hypothetical protein
MNATTQVEVRMSGSSQPPPPPKKAKMTRFECPHCDKKTASNQALNKHINATHGDTPTTHSMGNPLENACNLCNYRGATPGHLERHWDSMTCQGMPRLAEESGELQPPQQHGSPFQQRVMNPSTTMEMHTRRLESEYSEVKVRRGLEKLDAVFGGQPGPDENWAFPSELLDICSIVNVGLKYGVPNSGIQEFIRLFKSMACEDCDRINAIPLAFRTLKGRVMSGYDYDCMERFEYVFPDNVNISDKRAPFALKKFSSLLNEMVEDPRVMEPGSFYFGDSGAHKGKYHHDDGTWK